MDLRDKASIQEIERVKTAALLKGELMYDEWMKADFFHNAITGISTWDNSYKKGATDGIAFNMDLEVGPADGTGKAAPGVLKKRPIEIGEEEQEEIDEEERLRQEEEERAWIEKQERRRHNKMRKILKKKKKRLQEQGGGEGGRSVATALYCILHSTATNNLPLVASLIAASECKGSNTTQRNEGEERRMSCSSK